jgi:hypothetical protein
MRAFQALASVADATKLFWASNYRSRRDASPACEWPWTDYTFHPFPVLSSSKHTPFAGRAHRIHTPTSSEYACDHGVPWRQLLWAAIVKLTSLYVDVPEFVFAEINGKSPISAFRAITAATEQESVTWADLSLSLHELERHHIPVPHARAALGLPDSVNPYPLVVVWDCLTPELVDVDGSAVVVEVATQNEKNGISLSPYDGITRLCLRMPPISS